MFYVTPKNYIEQFKIVESEVPNFPDFITMVVPSMYTIGRCRGSRFKVERENWAQRMNKMLGRLTPKTFFLCRIETADTDSASI
jgi:hypothetical protein